MKNWLRWEDRADLESNGFLIANDVFWDIWVDLKWFFGYIWAFLTSLKYSQISLRFRVRFVLRSHFCPSFCLILTFSMFHSLVITFSHPVLFCQPRLPLKFKSTHHSKLFQPFSLNLHLFSSSKIIFIAIHLLQWRRKVFRFQNAISRVFLLKKTQI